MTRIGLVTDSSSQLTDDLTERFDVEVVPMTVTVDGTDYLEGVDIDADAFYSHFEGRTPEVSTSQPSPGAFASTYARLAEAGVDEIVSVHLSQSMSGTIDSACLAASDAPVPVRVIDTGSASFGVGICVWAAGVAIGRGANLDDLERRIQGLVPRLSTAFMVGVPLLTERGGRAGELALDDEGVPIVSMVGGQVEMLERAATVDDTVDILATFARRQGDGATIAIGVSDEPSRPLAERLERSVTGISGVDGVVHYRIGPSIGAHTGPGTFGLFVFPTIR